MVEIPDDVVLKAVSAYRDLNADFGDATNV